jgi:hypothetical protein
MLFTLSAIGADLHVDMEFITKWGCKVCTTATNGILIPRLINLGFGY